MPHLTNMVTSLDSYAKNWEFAGYAFTTLRTLTGSGSTARFIVAGMFLITVGVVTVRLMRHFRTVTDPATEEYLALRGCYIIALAFLLLTPTLQPWYALSLALFLPFCAGPAGIVLCWGVFLTYQVQIPYFLLGRWLENPYVTAAVFWAPVAAGFLTLLPLGQQRFANVLNTDQGKPEGKEEK